MDKHTFKVGDRVCFIVGKAEVGTIIKSHEEISGNWLVLRDDGYACAWAPYYSYQPGAIKHDTDFQVGDWVRYEGVAENYIGSLEGHVGTLIGGVHSDSARVQFPGITDIFLTANLVKIQPPQEEKKMDIKRKHSDAVITHNVSPGDVHYKGRVLPGFYQEITGNFYPTSEWEPVEEWVNIEVLKSDVGRLPFMTSYVDGDTLRWRYPK